MRDRPRTIPDAQVEAVQGRSRPAWNRMVERDEQAELRAVGDGATDVAKAAAREGRQR